RLPGSCEPRLPDARRSVSGAHALRRALQLRGRPPVLPARSEDQRMSRVLDEPGLAGGGVPPPRRFRAAFLRGLLRERPSAAVGAVLVATFVVIAIIAPAIEPYGVHQQIGHVYAPPSASHWLGLDDGGIDMVSLLL